MTSGVYCILNTITGKRYVGSAINLHERLRDHKYQLCKKIHCNTKLQNTWNKHGEKVFTFEIIELVPKEKCIECEQKWIDFYNSCVNGYNIVPNARSNLGRIASPEAIKRQSDGITKYYSTHIHTKKGKKDPESVRLNKKKAQQGYIPWGAIAVSRIINIGNQYAKGYHWTEAQRKKNSVSHIGKSSSRKGCHLTIEQRKKISNNITIWHAERKKAGIKLPKMLEGTKEKLRALGKKQWQSMSDDEKNAQIHRLDRTGDIGKKYKHSEKYLKTHFIAK